MDSSVLIERSDPRAPDALVCLQGYYNELATRFEEGFDVNQSLDPEADALRPPVGGFLLLYLNGTPAGCAAIKGNSTDIGELKRFWIAPFARGKGLAKKLLAEVETHARTLDMAVLRLETNRSLTEAIGLYRSSGYAEIPAFNDELYGDHWFEKRL